MLFKGFGPVEILMIVGILLLFFGAARLPALARSMGQSMRELKKGVSGEGENKSVEDTTDGLSTALRSPNGHKVKQTH